MFLTTGRQNELLDELARGEVRRAQDFAARQRALAELADLAYAEEGATGVEQFAAMELAGTCRKGRLAAQYDLADAAHYVNALPLTLKLLERGELFEHQARVLLKATESCSEEISRRAEAKVYADGGARLAPPDLRRQLKRAVLQIESELDADEVRARLQEARLRRRVTSRPEDDGMSSLKILGSAEQVRQAELDMERLVLQEKARDREAGVWRSTDQIRSDLWLSLPGLALQAADSPRTPTADTVINVLVPVLTALGRSSEPAYMEGYGPISAEHVQLLLPHARLRRTCVDMTGRLQELDEIDPAAGDVETARQRVLAMLRPSVASQRSEPQHDPSAALRRFVQVRSPRCDGVGCSTPSRQCHLDHRQPYPAGPTAEDNLDPRSAACHRAKHSGWVVTVEPDGSTTWTSPLGRTYWRPPPYDPPVLPPPLRFREMPDTDDGEAA